MIVHATCVALPDPADPAGWAGVLIRGPSGVGKSDLAVRLIDAGARLVADDRVELVRDGTGVRARPPSPIAGLLELRGVGVVQVREIEEAWLRLVIDPAGPDDERVPEPALETLEGVAVAKARTDYAAASAAARVRMILAATRLSLFAHAQSGLDASSRER